ncbi:MAG: hypothetical protein WBP12_03105 [Candidatus Saccharimonas sp.]
MTLLSKFGATGDSPEFHSHAIAKADDFQARTIGSTDKSTFQQRKRVEHNRQLIAGYQAAGVHDDHKRDAKLNQSQGPTVSARLAVAGEQGPKPAYLQRREQAARVAPRVPGIRITSSPRPTFSEPSHRYNPYS